MQARAVIDLGGKSDWEDDEEVNRESV